MSKTEFLAKTFQGIVRFRNCVTLHKQENRSGRASYFVFIGYDAKGKRVRRSLGLDEGKAYALVTEINQRISQGRLAEAANAFDVATDLEVKASLRKLQGHGVDVTSVIQAKWSVSLDPESTRHERQYTTEEKIRLLRARGERTPRGGFWTATAVRRVLG